MFGVSFSELAVVFVIALLLFGPEKLPEIARTLGKLSGELKRNSDALRREFYNSVYKPNDEIASDLRALQRDLRSVKTEISKPLQILPEAQTPAKTEPSENEKK